MKHKRKRKNAYQKKYNKKLQTVVAASAIGVVGSAVILPQIVSAETEEFNPSNVETVVESNAYVEEIPTSEVAAEEDAAEVVAEPISNEETSEETVADVSAVETEEMLVNETELEKTEETSANGTELEKTEETLASETESVETETNSSNKNQPVVAEESIVSETTTVPEVSVDERATGIVYKVIYTDVETNKIVHTEIKSVAIRTTEKPATTEVTETAAEVIGYRLVEDQLATITATVAENRRNILNFNVVANKEKAVRPNEGPDFRAHLMTPTNDGPYITIERYWGNNRFNDYGNPDYTVTKNGDTVELLYKMGTTRINPDDLDLTEDAKKLGLTYDKVSNYIKGTITLDASVEIGTYEIGLVSKADSNVKASADLKIQSHKGFVPRRDLVIGVGFSNDRTHRIPVKNVGSSLTDAEYKRYGSLPVEFSEAENKPSTNLTYGGIEVTVTPFGYYIPDGTVAEATENTRQYDALFQLESLDALETFPKNHLSIAKFEQTGGSDKVKIALKDLSKLNSDIYYTPHSGTRTYTETVNDENGAHEETRQEHYWSTYNTPYIVQFTELPDVAGDYFVTFKVVDNLGLEKNFRLDFKTIERSQDGALTNADVRFIGNADTLPEGAKRVSIPTSSERQVIGTVAKNKDNARIGLVSLPEGITVTESGEVVKEEGKKLAPGIYTFEVKAIDGHFGDNAPTRSFNFEVTDVINPIKHQVWKEGETFAPIPVSLEGGSTITDIKVETGNDYAYITGNNANSTLEGSGILRTAENQTAKVIVTYKNAEGTTSVTSTTFTYEVQPSPEIELDLEVSNAKQTVKEGDSFENMVITYTQGATVEVDTSKLPRGTRYDSTTNTISGRGLIEGVYTVPVVAKLGDKTKVKFVELTVTPGVFAMDPIEETVQQLDDYTYTFNLPKGVTITNDWVFHRLPAGLTYNRETNTISGTPERPGESTFEINYRQTKTVLGREINRDATSTFKITVTPRPLEVTAEDRTVQVLDKMQDIKITATEGAKIELRSYLPEGLQYDPETQTISGTPERITYGENGTTIQIVAYYPGAESGTRVTKDINIKVTPLPVTVDATPKEQTVDLGTAMESIVISPSEHANISLWTPYSDVSEENIDAAVFSEYGIHYDPKTKTLFGTPSKLGNFNLVFQAANPEDLGGAVAKTTVSFSVVDDSLDLSLSRPIQTVWKGSSIRDAVIMHTEGATLTVDKTMLPDGITYDETTKTFSGKPGVSGTFEIPVTLTNARGTKTKSVIFDLTVLELPENTNSVQSADPSINKVIEGETSVSGKGQPNATVEVRLPNGEIKSVTVGEDGTWLIENVPAFEKGQSVTVKQTETDKTPSDAINATAVPVITQGDKGEDGAPGQNGMDGKDGLPGRDGVDGKDGKTPTVTATRGEKEGKQGTIVTIINGNGESVETFIPDGEKGDKGEDGAPGRDGVDGKTPTVTATRGEKEGKQGTIVTITNGDGEEVETFIPDGEKGDKGEDGAPGQNGMDGKDGLPGRDGMNGQDGKTPTITTTRGEKEGKQGTIVTITNGNGESVETFIPDGEKGDKGEDGAPGRDGNDGLPGRDGVDGQDGKTPTVTATRGEKEGKQGTIVTIINGNGESVETFIPDGEKGDKGEDGAPGRDGNDGLPGSDGVDGKDGKTPTIETITGKDSESNEGYWIIITDGNGKEISRTFVKNGKDGRDGVDGRDGKDGECGCDNPLKPENEQPKDEQPKGEEPKGEEPKGEEPKGEDPKGEEPKDEEPKGEEPKGEEPKGEEPKGEQPKGEEPKGEEPKGEEPKDEQPKGEGPKGEQPKGEEPKGEEPKGEEPKGEEPKDEEPKGNEPSQPNEDTPESLKVQSSKVMSLPETGEKETPYFITGAALMLLLMAGALVRKKQEDE
ncbi:MULTISPECIES: putative Ig domain-containing protein [unclassified Facklamia]|uniref:putative Ig domain-containing protein n=1 Tax=Aerococcaceae TaxID=186827 RepID=UPI0013BCF795|nr:MULTISPECIES: putative Ig domain-containing protein [unclassified Facklamia]NEW64383.1 LPXTG cell wall anchor domain-containing protein [Facklamia sp. 252]NEW67780.1 LPXTG cell wall anchor domain-containing protein [Facklamia sp. 253]QQD64844.1 putative Ig domain-containing protein [Aerococcaceae bacterium zg-252]